MRKSRRILTGLVAVAFVAFVTGCAPAETNNTQADGCATADLQTLTDGKLTIGTDSPAYGPWFVDDDPSNGEGYESAVAYAVAEELGFAASDVVWVVAPFNSVIAPGDKAFDFDINQISITDERKTAVDFSEGYYDVAQALVTVAGSSIEGKTSIADLKDATLGAAIGTTSYTTIEEVIAPNTEIQAFDSNDLAVQALQNGQIDGLVVDLPTAFYMTAVQLDAGVIVGQFAPTTAGEQFGLVLNLDSPLTECVSKAVKSLKDAGTLAEIEQQWLADVTNAPFFTE